MYKLIYTTELWLYTLTLGLPLDNKSIEEVSIRECLCVISQFSPGMGCHENIAGSCKVRLRANGVVKEVESFCFSTQPSEYMLHSSRQLDSSHSNYM